MDEIDHEGGDENPYAASAEKWKDCSCCFCDFVIGLAFLIVGVVNIAALTPVFVGSANVFAVVYYYLVAIRFLWVIIAIIFCMCPGCANSCRTCLRGCFGCITFIVTLVLVLSVEVLAIRLVVQGLGALGAAQAAAGGLLGSIAGGITSGLNSVGFVTNQAAALSASS